MNMRGLWTALVSQRVLELILEWGLHANLLNRILLVVVVRGQVPSATLHATSFPKSSRLWYRHPGT